MVNFKSGSDLCVEFAHLLSNFITLERKSIKLLVNMQDNLIMVAAEIDVIFDFAVYSCSQKYNRKIECSKNLAKWVFADGNFLYLQFKVYVVFMFQILLLMAKYFIVGRHFLKTVYINIYLLLHQYLFCIKQANKICTLLGSHFLSINPLTSKPA